MNASVRLQSVAPDLVELSRSLHPRRRKEIALLTAKWACDRTGVSIVPDLERLFDNAYSPVQRDCEVLAEYIANYDDEYFSIVEHDDTGDISGVAMSWFSKARSLASLLYAIDGDSVANFCEALYEAHAATNDMSGLREIWVGFLKNLPLH